VSRSPIRFAPPAVACRAFTLLEVLLALALALLVVSAVGMAINLQMRLLNSGRSEVEQAQLARAILRRIADDLHNAVQYNAPPTSSQSSGSSSSSSASSGGTGGTSSPGSATSLSDLSDDSMSSDDQGSVAASDLSNATTLPAIPGIYGNANQLQIDVSRLPRLDQLQALVATDTPTTTPDRLTDVKNVLYYSAASATGGAPATGSSTTTGNSSATAGSSAVSGDANGLLRREMSRAVAALASQQGQLQSTQGTQEMMAAEVTDLEFMYYDGSDWNNQWDTTQNNGLPMAVQISITLGPVQSASPGPGAGAGRAASSTQNQETQTYLLTVYLPTAQPNTDSSGASTSGTSTSGSSSGGSSTSPGGS
jgi:prepilin-type N-terminal cleavage/methylation domain-containing protein